MSRTLSKGVTLNVGELGLAADVYDNGGPWIILLHGGGQTRQSWRGAASALAEAGYSVLTYDARGHGHSQWSTAGDYSLTRLTADLETIAARLDGPLILIGASIGGLTAFCAATRSLRERVAALVLVDITLRPNLEGSARIHQFMAASPEGFATLDEAADAIAAYNPARPRSSHAEGLNRNLRRGEDGRYRWLWDPRLLDAGPNAELPGFAEPLIAAAPALIAPTLLVHGRQSDVVDEAAIEEMKILIRGLEVRDIAGAGHMVAGDRNDHFLAGVTPFLNRMLPPTPRARTETLVE